MKVALDGGNQRQTLGGGLAARRSQSIIGRVFMTALISTALFGLEWHILVTWLKVAAAMAA